MQPRWAPAVRLHLLGAHLLPKLRCQFAEFLQPSSLKRLRIFISPTCVGLRYGRSRLELSGFSWELGIGAFAEQAPLVVTPQLSRADLPTQHAYTFEPGQPTPGAPNLLRPHIASGIGTGILTCFPSTTHFCLALGADSPCADERCAGNLGLTAMSAVALPIPPACLTARLRRLTERSPTRHAIPAIHSLVSIDEGCFGLDMT